MNISISYTYLTFADAINVDFEAHDLQGAQTLANDFVNAHLDFKVSVVITDANDVVIESYTAGEALGDKLTALQEEFGGKYFSHDYETEDDFNSFDCRIADHAQKSNAHNSVELSFILTRQDRSNQLYTHKNTIMLDPSKSVKELIADIKLHLANKVAELIAE